MNFDEIMREDQRLVLLRLLARQTQYKANSSVLTAAMDNLGHSISRDQVKTHLRWLEEQGLVAIEEPIDGLLVAKLTERGQDVACGNAVVHGVKKPGA